MVFITNQKKIVFTKGLTVAGKTTTAKELEEVLRQTGLDVALFLSASIKKKLWGDYYKATYGVPWPDPDYYKNDHPVGNPQRFRTIYAMCFGYDDGIKRVEGALDALVTQHKETVILDSTFMEREKRELVYDLARKTDAKVYSIELICQDPEEIKRRFVERIKKRVKTRSPEFEAAEEIIYSYIQATEIREIVQGKGIDTDNFPGLVRIGYDTVQGIANPVVLVSGARDQFADLLITSLIGLYQRHQINIPAG